MYDIILVAVPYTYISVPPLAPAVLRGAAESEGYTVKTIDLGMELYKQCGYDRAQFDHIQEYFIASEYTQFTQDDIQLINTFIDVSAQLLIDIPSRYIGISVFSYYAHLFAYKLLTKIRELDSLREIVVGGPGCATEPSSALKSVQSLTGIEKITPYGKFLHKRKLTDHVILGDGEQALITLLSNGAVKKKTNHIVDYKNIVLPYANFDDYELSKYPGQLNKGYPQLPIFGSKGCVRNCDFCDVNGIQGKFRFRTGKNIVSEILYLADRYDIRDFNFTDSLVNGSLSSFMEWISELAEYNKANPKKRITWNGSWICRPIGQMPQKYYAIMAESGCESVSTGFESGSNNVLLAMDKKTNVAAYYHEVEQFTKHGIKVVGLFLIGHWSEQWDDFLKTCDFLYNMIPHSRSGQLIGINPGVTGIVLPNTPIAGTESDETKLDIHSMEIWWNKNNPTLTAKERYFRLMLVIRLCKDLKIRIIDNSLPWAYTVLQRESDILIDFYQKQTAGLEITSSAERAYMNYDSFLKLILTRNAKRTIDLEFEIESAVSNEPPSLLITFNNNVLMDVPVIKGQHKFKFAPPPEQLNRLTIKFYNKKPTDTVVSPEGEILNDTFLVINKMSVDGIELTTDYEFFYNNISYIEQGEKVTPKQGFWVNDAELMLAFENPFFVDYGHRSDKNSVYDCLMITSTNVASSYYETADEVYMSKIVEILQTFPV